MQSLSNSISLENLSIFFKKRFREGNFYSDYFRDITVSS